MTPENAAQFEYHKMQLIGSLQTLANNMKECAAVAEQYAHIISGVPYMGNPFPPLANGQYPMPIMAPMGQDEQGKKRKARGDDGEGKRRVKKPKDPNAPKRPASSYLLFQNDVRNELKQKNPGMRNAELLSTISRLWSEMPQAQKDTYENRNKELKDQWRANKAVYESGKAEASGLPVAAIAPSSPVMTVPAVAKAVLAAAATKAVPTAAATAEDDSSDEESPAEEDEDSSSDSSSGDEAPPPKKSKKEAAVAAAKDEVAETKEKKHKKTKA